MVSTSQSVSLAEEKLHSMSLSWYRVTLRVDGFSSEYSNQVVSELQEYLDQRPYLKAPKVSWSSSEQLVIVNLESEGIDEEQTSNQVAEEVLELAAVLSAPIDNIEVSLDSVYKL